MDSAEQVAAENQSETAQHQTTDAEWSTDIHDVPQEKWNEGQVDVSAGTDVVANFEVEGEALTADGGANVDVDASPSKEATTSDGPAQYLPDSGVVDEVPHPGPSSSEDGHVTGAPVSVGEMEKRDSSFGSSQCSTASVDTVKSARQHQDSPTIAEDSRLEPDANSPTEWTSTVDTEALPASCEAEQHAEELPTTEFKTGITCRDVPTALDILNTRYRLNDVTIHKNMITWSSWNIGDIVRGPHRDSFWWKGRRHPRRIYDESATKPKDQENDQTEEQDPARQDIEDMCERIDHKEREIELMLQRMDAERTGNDARDSGNVGDVEIISAHTAPQTCAAPPGSPDSGRRKRENVFQRLLRALRRRLSRQQPQQQSPHHQQEQQQQQQQPQHRPDKQAIQKRQRTL